MIDLYKQNVYNEAMKTLKDLSNEIKAHFGSYKILSEQMGLSSMAVSQWFKRESIRSDHAFHIEKISNGHFKAEKILKIFNEAKS